MHSIVTMKWSVILATVLIGGAVVAEIDDSPTGFPSIDLNNLPGNIPVPNNLPVDISHVPTVEEGEKLFEEKCKKMGRHDAYEKAVTAKDEVQECVKKLVNITELQAEMEVAKPTGDLDMVFRKYCRKSPDLQYCITNFTATIEPCLDEKEKENKHLIQNITDSIIKFICFKEGDRIALFIAEGGPECLSSKQEAIQQCVNETITKNLPKETISVENLPSFIIGEEQCSEMTSLQLCVVGHLEKCAEPTPANIIDSLFNFVRKMTPCSKQKVTKTADHYHSNIAATYQISRLTVLLLPVVILFARITH